MKVTEIVPGLNVSVSGNRYQVVKRLDITTLIVKDEFDNERIVSIQDISISKLDKPRKIYEGLSKEDREIAESRFDIIKPIIDSPYKDGVLVRELAKKHNLNPTTLYRWINTYYEYGEIAYLAPNYKKRGAPGQPRVNNHIELIIQKCIDELYLNGERHTIKFVYKEIKSLCNKASINPPHISTLRERIKALDPYHVIMKRHGKKAADDKYSTSESKYEQAEYPLHIVEVDHTELDIELVDEKYRMPIGRPIITVAIDVYSRMIVGIYVSLFTGPGFFNVGMCIANSILPKFKLLKELGLENDLKWNVWGKMKVLHVDNALEFRGNNLAKVCKNYNIDIFYRKLKNARDGGHIEKFNDTLSKKLQDLPGKTFNNIIKKQEYDSLKNASLTLKEFEKWLLYSVLGEYHNSFHEGIGKSPIQMFEEGIGNNIEEGKIGRGMPPIIEDEEKVRIDFLPSEERTIQANGVTIFRTPYFATDLNSLFFPKNDYSSKTAKPKKYVIKYDPRNIKYIYLLDSDNHRYIELTAKDLISPNISLWEFKAIYRELKAKNVKNIDHQAIFKTHEEQKKIVAEALANTKNKRRSELKKISVKYPDKIDLNTKKAPEPTAPIERKEKKIIKPFDEFDYGTFE